MNEGIMFTFYKDPYCKTPVFLMGKSKRCILWVGGQTESFLNVGYFSALASALSDEWSFAQVELASSRVGFGAQDHMHDAEDLNDLITILVKDHQMTEVALFGTGTGVQVLFDFLEKSQNAIFVTRVILYGVVCDPESPLFTADGAAARREHVAQLIADGRHEDTRSVAEHYDIPITPARLAGGGFPTLQEAIWCPAYSYDVVTMRRALGVVRVPLLVMLAHHSQYHPAEDHLKRVMELVEECAGSTHVTVAYFNDTCDERRRVLKAAEAEHMEAIVQFLSKEDKRCIEEAERDRVLAIENERKAKSLLQAAAFGVGSSSRKSGSAQ